MKWWSSDVPALGRLSAGSQEAVFRLVLWKRNGLVRSSDMYSWLECRRDCAFKKPELMDAWYTWPTLALVAQSVTYQRGVRSRARRLALNEGIQQAHSLLNYFQRLRIAVQLLHPAISIFLPQHITLALFGSKSRERKTPSIRLTEDPLSHQATEIQVPAHHPECLSHTFYTLFLLPSPPSFTSQAKHVSKCPAETTGEQF